MQWFSMGEFLWVIVDRKLKIIQIIKYKYYTKTFPLHIGVHTYMYIFIHAHIQN